MKKLAFVLLGAFALVSCNQEKTAYVDTKVLIKDYSPMKSAEAKFTKMSDDMKKEFDSIGMAFQKEVQDYQKEQENLTSKQREERESKLMQKQQILQRQQQMKSTNLRNQSDKVIDSLIDVVKDYVADYGKKNGYTYIFGSNETANIMYAKDGKDITQEILKELNGKIGASSSEKTESSETKAE